MVTSLYIWTIYTGDVIWKEYYVGGKCQYEIMKQAFLFSGLCGLRVSDIRKLKWCDLQKSGERMRIEIKMQKTKEPLYLPISDEALKWLPQRGEAKDDDFIFVVLRECTPDKRKQIIDYLLANMEGIGLVIIDSIRDLRYDINSPSESSELINLLMKWLSE